jgi:hypothetical protein
MNPLKQTTPKLPRSDAPPHRSSAAFRLFVPLLPLLTAILFSPISGTSATLRIGYQKAASTLVLLKAHGTLEKKLAPLNIEVKWLEFAAGPQLLEGLNLGSTGQLRGSRKRAGADSRARTGHCRSESPALRTHLQTDRRCGAGGPTENCRYVLRAEADPAEALGEGRSDEVKVETEKSHAKAQRRKGRTRLPILL